MRRSHGSGKKAIHYKFNYSPSPVPQLLKCLELKGCLVTIDAMGCQKYIAKEIVSFEADYILARQSPNSSPSRTILQKHLMLNLKGMRFISLKLLINVTDV